MNRTQQPLASACIAATVLFVVAALIAQVADRSRGLSFDSVQQACEALRSAGYYCTSDRLDGAVGHNFMVSREPMTWQEVGGVIKSGPMGERWKERVWLLIPSIPYGQKTQPRSKPSGERAFLIAGLWESRTTLGCSTFDLCHRPSAENPALGRWAFLVCRLDENPGRQQP